MANEFNERVYELLEAGDVPSDASLLVDHPNWLQSKRVSTGKARPYLRGDDPTLVMPAQDNEPSAVPGKAIVFFDGVRMRVKLPDGSSLPFAPVVGIGQAEFDLLNTTEREARVNGDVNLGVSVTAEATARQNGDSTLTVALAAEVSARAAADTNLAALVTAEANARQVADNTLAQQIAAPTWASIPDKPFFGTASGRNIGTGANTAAAGDDSRFYLIDGGNA